MKSYRVVISGRALNDLEHLKSYIAQTSGAARFIDRILSDCEKLSIAPHRGMRRDDLPPDMRRIGIARGRASLIFAIAEDVVTILAVHYAGLPDDTSF